jgi:alcohol dehydrogenase (cytochrome c)
MAGFPALAALGLSPGNRLLAIAHSAHPSGTAISRTNVARPLRIPRASVKLGQNKNSGGFMRLCDFILLSGLCIALPALAQERAAEPAKPVAPVTILTAPVTGNVASSDPQLLNADADQDNWLLYGRTYDNQRFSPLTQIGKDNVRRLAIAATIHTGFINSFEATPIVVDGTMYVAIPNDHVQAYDAVTGALKWSYNPVLEYTDNCCGPQARGVAVAYGKVFVAQLDGHVVALDAHTGQVAWKSVVADTIPAPTHYYAFTMAPQVFNGMVLVGNSGAEYPTRGFVEALDAATGKLVWRFYTTAAPDQPGGKSWSEDSWKYGGGSVWDTPAVDPKNNLVLFATGNPNPDYWGENRKGDNAYTDSIVAIDSRTGKLRWWYQQVPHDLWDYDCPSPVVLFDARDGHGNVVPAAAEAGKLGNVFIINRLTGKLLHKSDAFVKQAQDMFVVPTDKPFNRYPGINGGNLWSPAAYSPLTQNFYVMGINQAFGVTAFSFPKYVPGKVTVGQQVGGTQKPSPTDQFPVDGNLTAVNVNTGKIAWQHKTDLPMYGGVLATASNLVFAGEMNGYFDAFDAVNGDKLWSQNLGIGVCTPPITYRVKGVQYLAVGAAGCARSNGLLSDPSKSQFGDTIAIYTLMPN